MRLTFLGLLFCLLAAPSFAQSGIRAPASVEEVFTTEYTNTLVMRIEAAIAGAQSQAGLIPVSAAEEIAAKASPVYAPAEEIEAEYEIVRHRMVALLNVWRRRLGAQAADALHLGVTTVDIYDTVMILQLLHSSDMMIADLQAMENELLCLAAAHSDTAMIGRTLGQHALPISFGAKVSGWAAQAGRHIERLGEVQARLRTSGILKGAVGTYLGLGPDGMEIERGVALQLGLSQPHPADWRAARDVFAEYALTLALIARSNANIGGEIFRLQMTDIGELRERRPAGAVGSSTMPHKRNPALSEALIHHGRTIPALAEIILADVENMFERDNTSRPNDTLASISKEAARSLRDMNRLITRLEVDETAMRRNIDRTDGMIMSQRIVLHLARQMRREEAEEHVRQAAERSLSRQTSFASELLADQRLAPLLGEDLAWLLDPVSDLGLVREQVAATWAWSAERRRRAGEPSLAPCPGP